MRAVGVWVEVEEGELGEEVAEKMCLCRHHSVALVGESGSGGQEWGEEQGRKVGRR